MVPLKPRIFTFYSFKGGVGRSMALLNFAYVLAGLRPRIATRRLAMSLLLPFDQITQTGSFQIHVHRQDATAQSTC
jgi:hypothetical protein